MSLLGVGCTTIKAYPDCSVEVKEQLRGLAWCFNAGTMRNEGLNREPTAWRYEVVNCQIHTTDLQFTLLELSLAQEGILYRSGHKDLRFNDPRKDLHNQYHMMAEL
jgi:hypothetical protein